MDNRTINDTYAQIAQELIETEACLEHIRSSQATIMYLSSDHEKKGSRKVIYGECEKVPDKWKWAVPCDFTITVFEPNVERFDEDGIRKLLLHELMHVGIDVDGNEEKYWVIPHDVEDFEEMIKRYGIRWADETGQVKKSRKRPRKSDE